MSEEINLKEINSKEILEKINSDIINSNVIKKRGRPKKINQQVVSSNTKVKLPLTTDNEEDEIILHLPISKKDILSLNIDNYDINDVIENKLLLDENHIKNESDDEQNDNKEDAIETSERNYISNDIHLKQLGLIIRKLKEENDELKKFLTEITPMYFTEVKVYPVDLKIFDINDNEIIPKKTNLSCWWCTYGFDTLPTYLPEEYNNNKFYVSGCFCSFNCASAYNLSLNDSKTWDRYALLKRMYYDINKDKISKDKIKMTDIEINVSGPKELLEKYGGPMKIEDYRKNSKILGREYHKLMPPFIPITIGYEEITNSKNNSKNININNLISSISKNDNIIIKRNKPVNNMASKYIDSYIE